MALELVKSVKYAIRPHYKATSHYTACAVQIRGLFGHSRMSSNHIDSGLERSLLYKPFLLDPVPGAELRADGSIHREDRDWVSELELDEVSRLTDLASSQGQPPRILVLYGSLRERLVGARLFTAYRQ